MTQDNQKVSCERQLCCLETWLHEIQDDPKAWWLIATYANEIKTGEYVSDEEFEEWLTLRRTSNQQNFGGVEK